MWGSSALDLTYQILFIIYATTPLLIINCFMYPGAAKRAGYGNLIQPFKKCALFGDNEFLLPTKAALIEKDGSSRGIFLSLVSNLTLRNL